MKQEQIPSSEELIKNSETILEICARINRILDVKEAKLNKEEVIDGR